MAARADINRIAGHSTAEWGLARARTYVHALHDTFQQLAEFPELGRKASHIRLAYLRMDSGSHVIFNQKRENGILIIRILHERMDFLPHLP